MKLKLQIKLSASHAHCTCCYNEIEVADKAFYLTHSQNSDTGQSVMALTLQCQAPGRVATGVAILNSRTAETEHGLCRDTDSLFVGWLLNVAATG